MYGEQVKLSCVVVSMIFINFIMNPAALVPQTFAASNAQKLEQYSKLTESFFVPIKGFTVSFRPSGKQEAIEVLTHTEEWDYALFNPFTNTLRWQFRRGKVNKSAAFYEHRCEVHSPGSIEYQKKDCESYLFDSIIHPKDAITMVYETLHYSKEQRIKMIREAIQTGKVTMFSK